MVADSERPLIAYEYISIGPNDPVRNADILLKEGWQRRGLQRVALDMPMPWGGGADTRTFSFYVHALDVIDTLLKAYDITADLAYLRPAIAIAGDWVRQHPRTPETDEQAPFAWYDMAVGLRAYRLGYAYEAGCRAGLISTEDAAGWWQQLLDHATYLSDDNNIAFQSNHGYYQIAGQLALARRFEDRGAPFPALMDQGMVRMSRIMDSQFAPDGVHLEHSPDYHRMVYETLRGLLQAGLLTRDDIRQRALGIEDALSWFVRPNGRITNFGDSDSRLLNLGKPKAVTRRWITDAMKFAVTGGTYGQRPRDALRAFHEGGYAVLRQPHDDEPMDRDSYLAMAAAFHSRTHKHADDLSFVWDEYGFPILIDSGRYGYVGKAETGSDLWKEGFWYTDPNRVYIERTRAHNCLEFDGRDYLRKGRAPFGSALTGAQTQDGVTAIRAELRQFKSIRHSRTLLLAPRQWLIVLDAWHDGAGEDHSLRQWFQVHSDYEVTVEDGAYRIARTDDAHPALRACNLLGSAMPAAPICGQSDPLQGWWSQEERDMQPATSLCFQPPKAAAGSLATIFALGDQVIPKSAACRANTLARGTRLAFAIDGQDWQIDLTAPEDGEMELKIKAPRGAERG